MTSRLMVVLLLLLVLCLVVFPPVAFAQASYQTVTVVSVRSIRHMEGMGPSRFPHPIYFTVDFAFRASGQSYCTGYETPVLDEVQDLLATQGKNIQVEMRGKKLTVLLPTGRKIKARLEKPTQC